MSRADQTTRTPSSWVGALALGILFAGLGARGANTATLAALFGVLLAGCACAAAAIASSTSLRVFWRRHWVALGALALYVGYVTATAVVGLAPHPYRAALGLAAPGPLSPQRALEGLAALSAPITAYFVLRVASDSQADRERLFGAISVLSILFALYALALYSAGIGVGDGRISVNFGSANSAATTFGVLFVVNAAIALDRMRRNDRDDDLGALRRLSLLVRAPVSLSAAVFCAACLLLTASRGGLLATGAGLAVLALAMTSIGRTRAKPGRGLIGFALPLGAILFVGGEYAFRRFSAVTEDAAIRETMMRAHWDAYLERALFGHGLNTFHELNAWIATPENWPALFGTGAVHNIFIALLEENGALGAFLFALIVAPPMISVFLRTRSRRTEREFAAGAAAAIVLCLLHGLVDFGLQTPAIAALLAAIVGIANVDPAPKAAPSGGRARHARDRRTPQPVS